MSISPSQNFSKDQAESQWSPECVICKKSVKLEDSKADEYGQAIHGECYAAKLASDRGQ